MPSSDPAGPQLLPPGPAAQGTSRHHQRASHSESPPHTPRAATWALGSSCASDSPSPWLKFMTPWLPCRRGQREAHTQENYLDWSWLYPDFPLRGNGYKLGDLATHS